MGYGYNIKILVGILIPINTTHINRYLEPLRPRKINLNNHYLRLLPPRIGPNLRLKNSEAEEKINTVSQ